MSYVAVAKNHKINKCEFLFIYLFPKIDKYNITRTYLVEYRYYK